LALQSDGSWSEFDDVIVEAGARIQRDVIINVTNASLHLIAANKVSESDDNVNFLRDFNNNNNIVDSDNDR